MTHLTALFQGGSAPRPALHHLGWPWLGAPLLLCTDDMLLLPLAAI